MMDGQITITEYLSKQIAAGSVKDLTKFINSTGKAQYCQVEDLIRETGLLTKEEDIQYMTNKVSCYILDKSLDYMDYLRSFSKN